MKRVLGALAVWAFATTLGSAQVLVASNGFEGVESWSFTVSGTASGGSVTNLVSPTFEDPTNARIRTASYSWQSRRFPGGTTANASNNLEFASIAIDGFTGRQVRVHVAALSIFSTNNGMDGADIVQVSAAVDGAAFPTTPDLRINGAAGNNARWPFSATNIARTGLGTPLVVNAPQGNFSLNNYATCIIDLPDSATSVAVRVTTLSNATNELWCVDDVEVLRDVPDWIAPVTTTPPAFQPIGNKSATNNLALSFDVTALDNAEQDLITLSASNLPAGAVFNTVTNAGGVTNSFSWTPTAPGVVTTTFYAVDNDGVATSNVVITVLDPPSVSITTAAQSVPNAQTTIQVDGTASTNAQGEFHWTNTLNDAGGVIAASTAWSVPSVPLAVGANTFEIRVTNLFGEVAQASVVITRDFPPLSGCATPITFQGFEGADPWTIADGAGNISALVGENDNPPNHRILSGVASWQVQNGSVTLELASVSIEAYTGRYVTVRVTGVGTNTGALGVDAGDSVRIYAALDGAAFAAASAHEIRLNGNNNAKWGFDATGTYNAVAGTVNTIAAPQSGGPNITNYSALSVSIPDSATSLALRVWAANDAASEVWNIDDITVYGCAAGGPPADGDGDGMDDAWENAYFGSLTNEASGDFDGDFFNNLDEFNAGSLPNDGTSLLRVTNLVSVAGSSVFVHWQSHTGRVYVVGRSTNLLGAFDAVATNLAATPPTNSYEDVTAPGGAVFYNVTGQKAP